MAHDDLNTLRGEIDEVDTKLLALFEQRMALARRVGAYKAERSLPILDEGREAQVLAQRAGQVRDASLAEPVRAFFGEMMRLSRGQQETVCAEHSVASSTHTVAYQGLPGAFGHQALLQHFPQGARQLPCGRFEEVFLAVREGRAGFGIVPLENSSSGSISEVYDLLGRCHLWIVGEELVRVRHCLLGVPGATLSDIRTVSSHEQGFLQCGEFLDGYPGWQRIPCFNTAIAAKEVGEAGDRTRAAIASRLAGETYGLELLAEDIHSFASNFTRFVVIGRALCETGEKAAISFTLRHERGALHRALACFVALGLNLVRIESRPIPDSPWEYRFYVDVEGNLREQRLSVLLEVLSEDCASATLLGLFTPALREPAHG